jgi:hypothetical protein
VVVLLVFAGASHFSFPAWLALSATFLFLSLALLFLCGICFPASFRRGIQVVADGFQVWRPLRKPSLVRYSEIKSIVAVARGDGENNDELTFCFGTPNAKLSVYDHDLYVTGVFDQLTQIPGFNQAAFDRASSHEATLRDWLFGRRFSLLSQREHRDS